MFSKTVGKLCCSKAVNKSVHNWAYTVWSSRGKLRGQIVLLNFFTILSLPCRWCRLDYQTSLDSWPCWGGLDSHYDNVNNALYTRLRNDPSRTVLQMTCQACSSTFLILQKNNEYSDCFGLSRHKGLLPWVKKNIHRYVICINSQI